MAKKKEEKKVTKKDTKKKPSKKKENEKKVDIDKKIEKDPEVEEVKVEATVTEPVVEDKKVDEVVPEQVIEETIVMAAVSEDNTDTKYEKKKRFWDEVKSFFILIIIIGLVVLGGWLFLKYAKPFDSGKGKTPDKGIDTVVSENIKNYDVVTYNAEGTALSIIGDKYIVDSKNFTLIKIMDLDLNVLYESIDDDEYEVYVGVDGNIYAVEYFDIEESENAMFLYVLENGKLVQINEFVDEGNTYSLVFAEGYLIGVVSNKYLKNVGIYTTLSGEEYELDGFMFWGDGPHLDCVSFITYNSKYMVVKKVVDEKEVFGLYDLEKKEIIIEPNYDALYGEKGNRFVAVKNGKAGLIDAKLKKLIDFQYDFIEVHDDYYLVSKNNKIAVMNSNYELITDYEFDYQTDGYVYIPCCLNFPSIYSLKINGKYVLTINAIEEYLGVDSFKKHETYIINDDGTYKTIEANMFVIFDDYAVAYVMNEKTVEVYDTVNFKKIYTIDLSDYDFDDFPDIEVKGDTLIIGLESDLYYRLEDGIEKNDEVFKYSIDDVELAIYYNKHLVEINVEGINVFSKKIGIYDYHPNLDSFVKLDDDSLYFIYDDSFVKINKR